MTPFVLPLDVVMRSATKSMNEAGTPVQAMPGAEPQPINPSQCTLSAQFSCRNNGKEVFTIMRTWQVDIAAEPFAEAERLIKLEFQIA